MHLRCFHCFFPSFACCQCSVFGPSVHVVAIMQSQCCQSKFFVTKSQTNRSITLQRREVLIVENYLVATLHQNARNIYPASARLSTEYLSSAGFVTRLEENMIPLFRDCKCSIRKEIFQLQRVCLYM